MIPRPQAQTQIRSDDTRAARSKSLICYPARFADRERSEQANREKNRSLCRKAWRAKLS